ncbi:M23 family metallopeptidase [Actinomyces sp. zg296]|uniref:M23 family metallopeptidase n=1 Tax=Actinomyces sp. zg296 TaxID=2609289 RepID=UPI001F3BDCD6|nr:M23 family metallopeptidase [Actinomyces sp. zg296]
MPISPPASPPAWPAAPSPLPRASPGPHRALRLLVTSLAAVALAALIPLPAVGAPPAGPGAEVAARGAVLPVSAPLERAKDAHRRARYVWPTGGPVAVVEGFDPPAVVWGAGHRGVDLAVAAGSPVRAAGAGEVAFAGMVAGRPVISIDHADGIRTTYEPVAPSVAAGDAVGAGQVIGTLLPGHRSDGVDALHWGARTARKSYINPLRLLRPPVIRLKPAAPTGAIRADRCHPHPPVPSAPTGAGRTPHSAEIAPLRAARTCRWAPPRARPQARGKACS